MNANRGAPPPAIPGFFYDAQRGKYFRIQADHKLLDPNSKYSTSKANKVAHERKKRRRVERAALIKSKQTVRRKSVMDRSLASTGFVLKRETGSHNAATELSDRDAFYVSQMRSARIHVAAPNETCKMGSLHDIARTENGEAMIAFTHGNGSSLYRMPKFELASGTEQTISFHPNDDRRPLAAFSSPMVSLHLGKSSLLDNVDDGFQCTVVTRESRDPGNLFTVSLERTHFTYLKLGLRDSSIWASAASGSRIAIGGTDCIYGIQVSSGSAKFESKLDIPGQSRALDWISHNTVAFGVGSNDEVDKGHRKQQKPSHGVQLWDLRSSGTALRLKRMKPVTGLKARDTSQLLVSDNHRISLFDLRYEKDPILFWNHLHQGPQLQFDTMVNGSIMAALDADNNVQTYSLQSGKAIAALQPPPISTRNEDTHRREVLMGKVRWTAEDTTLQACQGDSLIVWNYGGLTDDEA